MPRVFILGAGASKFAGYPLSQHLWSFVKEHKMADIQSQQIAEEVFPFIKKAIKQFSPEEKNFPNLELIFTQLDLLAMGVNSLAFGNIKWSEIRPKLMGMITNAFLWHEYVLQDNLLKGAG